MYRAEQHSCRLQFPEYCGTLWHCPRRAVGHPRHIEAQETVLLTEISIKRYKEFKDFQKRICVATDVFGRGIDIEKVNIAINYDLPADADSYLHRVGRAGRFGTKGVSISFVSSDEDQEVLKNVEKRFQVPLP